MGPQALTETQSQAKTQVAHTCHSSTWKVGAVGAGIQGYPCLDGEFEASLGYSRPCYKTTEQLRGEFEARTKAKSQPKGQWRFLDPQMPSAQTSLQSGVLMRSPCVLSLSSRTK